MFEPNLPLWNALPRLEARYTLGLFSNNPPFIRSIFPRDIKFRHVFLSPQFHATKPDIAVFKAVDAALGLPPQQILFVDDKKENTEQACSLGWNAIEFKSNDQLDQELTRLGIW
ncbi:MAG: HAD-IA family hydrolase [Pseudomonadota bacterium]